MVMKVPALFVLLSSAQGLRKGHKVEADDKAVAGEKSGFCSYPMWFLPGVGTEHRCDHDEGCPLRIAEESEADCLGVYGVMGGQSCTVACKNDPARKTTFTCTGWEGFERTGPALDCSAPASLAEALEARKELKASSPIHHQDIESSLAAKDPPCADPVAAVRKTLGCIETKDSACATEGYAWSKFKKYHNHVDTNTLIFPIDIYWSMALKFSTFKLDYDYAVERGPNFASVRYVETVRMSDGSEFGIAPNNNYPFNKTIIQYEHAYVALDNGCRITRWDQYGDDQEQDDVTDAMAAFMADQRVKCNLSLALPWQCKDLPGMLP